MSYAPTLANYQRFFTDPVFLPVFWRTCLLCLEVAVLAVGFGYPVAFFLAGLEGRKKYTLLLPAHGAAADELCDQDLCHPQHPRRQRLLESGAAGVRHSSTSPSTLFVYNLNAVLLTLTALLIPFAVLPIFLSLERIPRNLLEASADLGASNLQSFRRVVLPLSLPGTATAATFVFVLAIGDFLTPQMVGGLSGFTFGRIIYSQFGTAFNWPFGSALSVILAAVVILAIAAGARLGGRQRGAS